MWWALAFFFFLGAIKAWKFITNVIVHKYNLKVLQSSVLNIWRKFLFKQQNLWQFLEKFYFMHKPPIKTQNTFKSVMMYGEEKNVRSAGKTVVAACHNLLVQQYPTALSWLVCHPPSHLLSSCQTWDGNYWNVSSLFLTVKHIHF